jgi:hypothetical protein
MKIGDWRTRSVFERHAIVGRSDMNDAILKLQESENRVEQERLQAEEQQDQTRAQIGHNEGISSHPPASRAVNQRQLENDYKVGWALVPGGGVEPPRAEARRILSPLRLPVPPSRLRGNRSNLQSRLTMSVLSSARFSSILIAVLWSNSLTCLLTWAGRQNTRRRDLHHLLIEC